MQDLPRNPSSPTSDILESAKRTFNQFKGHLFLLKKIGEWGGGQGNFEILHEK